MVTFADHVQPIFKARCGSCHNGSDRKGGLALDNYKLMLEGGASGNVLESGDPGASYLWSLVTHESEPKMPPNADKMPEAELAIIRTWIEGGLLENSGSTAIVSDKPKLAKVEIKPGERPAEIALPQRYLGDPTTIASHANGVTALAVSPWASLAAVSGHRQITLLNTNTLDVLGVLPFPEGQAEIVRFSSAGDLMMVGGGRGGAMGKVVVFDVKTGERRIEVGDEYDTVLSADISPDQTMIALGGPKRMVRVYSTQTGELLYEKKKHTDWVTAVAFSPDGVLLCTGDRANGVVVWEAHTGQIFYDLIGHKGAISDISWRPDSNVVATASEDGNIKLWDMNNGAEVRNWGAHGGGVTSMDFTREGQLVSIGRDQVARLWNGDGNKVVDCGGLTDLGMEVAYDAESKRILAGDWTGTIIVWNAEGGAELGRFNTNPPTLAMRLDTLSQQLAAADGNAKAKGEAFAALSKEWSDKQALAQATQVEATAAAEKATLAATMAQQAQQVATAEQQTLTAATEALQKALTQAQIDAEALTKAAEAFKAAEAALAAAKAAFEEAEKTQATAQAALSTAQTVQTAATDAEAKSKEAYAAAQKAFEDAQAADKAAAELAATTKAAAEAALAASMPNEQQQQAITQTQAEAQAAQQQLDALNAKLQELQAAQQQLAPQ
jgi:hypothetical protein